MVSLDRQAPWNEDGDAARSCNALKPCRNVHTISKDVVRLDDYIADVDAYAEGNAIVFRLIDCKSMNACLKLYRSSDRFNGACKLRHEAIAGVLHDAATVLGDCWMDRIRHERGKLRVRGLLVMVHQSRIASRVGSQYRSQPSLNPLCSLLRHRTEVQRQDTV